MATSNKAPENRCKRKYKGQGLECGGLLIIEKVEDIYCIKCLNCSTYIFPPVNPEVTNLEAFNKSLGCSKVV